MSQSTGHAKQYNAELVQQMIAGGDAGSKALNDELYPLVVAGNAKARTRMIESNMSLVIAKVDSYIGCYPEAAHLRDDLISEGFLGLTTAVNRMADQDTKENANATGYISYWIMHSIGTVLDQESGVGASLRTKQRAFSQDSDLNAQIQEARPAKDIIADPMSLVDLRDEIESCCETDIDRAIVRMRERAYHSEGDPDIGNSPCEYPGMVDKEIAKALDLPVTTTYMLRRAIYARFLAKNPHMKGEV